MGNHRCFGGRIRHCICQIVGCWNLRSAHGYICLFLAREEVPWIDVFGPLVESIILCQSYRLLDIVSETSGIAHTV